MVSIANIVKLAIILCHSEGKILTKRPKNRFRPKIFLATRWRQTKFLILPRSQLGRIQLGTKGFVSLRSPFPSSAFGTGRPTYNVATYQPFQYRRDLKFTKKNRLLDQNQARLRNMRRCLQQLNTPSCGKLLSFANHKFRGTKFGSIMNDPFFAVLTRIISVFDFAFAILMKKIF